MDGIRGEIEQLLDAADAEELELVLIFLACAVSLMQIQERRHFAGGGALRSVGIYSIGISSGPKRRMPLVWRMS